MITGGCRGEGNPTSQKPKEFTAFAAFRRSGAVCENLCLCMAVYPPETQRIHCIFEHSGVGSCSGGNSIDSGDRHMGTWARGLGPGARGLRSVARGPGTWGPGPGASPGNFIFELSIQNVLSESEIFFSISELFKHFGIVWIKMHFLSSEISSFGSESIRIHQKFSKSDRDLDKM